MHEAEIVALRMRDVGIALRVAEMHGQVLNRIRLQKFIYLLDALCRLYDVLPPENGHITYRHGPYDRVIQNAVDSLAFRRLVKFVSTHEDEQGNLQTEYALSAGGRQWTDKLTYIESIRMRIDAASSIGKELDRLGWHRLRELVYAEPTFLSARASGYGQRLRPTSTTDNSAAALIQLARATLASGFTGSTPTRELLMNVFFGYLDAYSQRAR